MEGAATQAELRGVGDGDGLLEGGTTLGVHDSTDIGRPGSLQQLDSRRDVLRAELTVSVDAHDDLVLRSGHTEVKGLGGGAAGIVDDPNAIVPGSQLLSDLSGAVSAGSDGEDDLHLSRVALIEDTGHRFLEIPFLVPHRYDNTDRGREV